jgi:uncharacterized protein (TIGR03067 family)
MESLGRCVMLLVTVAAAPLAAQSRAPSDSARLQGSWTMVSGAADGVPLPPEYVKGMKRTLNGSNLVVSLNGQLYFSATIVLDPAKSPRAIDYHMTGGFTTGAVQRGIYAISGDTLRFSFGAPNAARPTDFTSTSGDGRTISMWLPAHL